MVAAERLIKDASKTVDQLEATVDAALAIASNCHQRYVVAPPHIRRQLNQGFFEKLFIAEDGSVEHAELTEPFAQLLAPEDGRAPNGAQSAPDAPTTLDVVTPRGSAPGRARGAQGADRSRPMNVLVTSFGSDVEDVPGDRVPGGSKEAGLVPAVGFEPTLSRA